MKFCLRILLFLFLLTGTLTQDFDLADFLDDLVPPTPAKPKDLPQAPEKPKTDGGFGLDLADVLDPDPANPKPDKPAVKPPISGGGGSFDDSDLFDFGGGGEYKPDPGRPGRNPSGDPTPKPDKPTVKPPKSRDGGGGGLDLEVAFGPEPTDCPPGGVMLKDMDRKLNRIIEIQEKMLKVLEQQRPRTSSRF